MGIVGGFFSKKKKNLLPNSIEKKIIYQKDGKDISNKTMLFSTRSVGLFEEKLPIFMSENI